MQLGARAQRGGGPLAPEPWGSLVTQEGK